MLTTSFSLRLCVVVFAAETLASNVVVTLLISPVTCSFCVWKKYNPEEIPDTEPAVFPTKNNPSLVLPIPTLLVTRPMLSLPLSMIKTSTEF